MVPIPPGETIKKLLNERYMLINDFAEAIGLSRPKVHALFDGRLMITPAIAEKLESVFMISQKYWLNLEIDYCLKLAGGVN